MTERTEERMNRDEILRKLDDVQNESAAYWSAFDTPTFFAKLGEGWSPAENVRHLVKSIRPVTMALKLPRLILRFKFGKPRRASMEMEELRVRYQGLLDAGGRAGRFAPSPREAGDPESWRAEILAQHAEANRALGAAIARWPDAKLDQYQLPHPLLGNLTVREMLYFTLYHQLHHINVVKRKSPGREAGAVATAVD
jgi:hypothetical protein